MVKKGSRFFCADWILWLTLVLYQTGCNNDKLSKNELVKYIDNANSGLVQSAAKNKLNIQLKYMPTQLLFSGHRKNADSIAGMNALNGDQNFDSLSYFVLSMSYDNRELLSTMNYGPELTQRIMDFTFNMDENCFMIGSNNDTIPLLGFNHSRAFGYAPSTEILLVYEKRRILAENEINWVFKDLGLGLGITRFSFKTANIRNCPQLLDLKANS